MIRKRAKLWAVKTPKGNLLTDVARMNEQPVVLFRRRRDALYAAADFSRDAKAIKVSVLIEEV